MLDEFRARVLARLVLLPRDDPQFRRNRERVVRDGEREAISLEWDLGIPEEGLTRRIVGSKSHRTRAAHCLRLTCALWTTASSTAS